MTLTTIRQTPYTLASLLLLASSLLASGTPLAAETPDSALPPVVSIATAAMGELAAKTHVSGTLAAKQEILINPQINGYGIQQIKVEVGDKVAAGDTLIVLDDKTLAAQLAQADAKAKRSGMAMGIYRDLAGGVSEGSTGIWANSELPSTAPSSTLTLGATSSPWAR